MNHFKFFDQKLKYINKVNWTELTKAVLTIYNDIDRAHYSDHKNEMDIFIDQWLNDRKRQILKEIKEEYE